MHRCLVEMGASSTLKVPFAADRFDRLVAKDRM
jgi:hypothetical protein